VGCPIFGCWASTNCPALRPRLKQPTAGAFPRQPGCHCGHNSTPTDHRYHSRCGTSPFRHHKKSSARRELSSNDPSQWSSGGDPGQLPKRHQRLSPQRGPPLHGHHRKQHGRHHQELPRCRHRQTRLGTHGCGRRYRASDISGAQAPAAATVRATPPGNRWAMVGCDHRRTLDRRRIFMARDRGEQWFAHESTRHVMSGPPRKQAEMGGLHRRLERRHPLKDPQSGRRGAHGPAWIRISLEGAQLSAAARAPFRQHGDSRRERQPQDSEASALCTAAHKSVAGRARRARLRPSPLTVRHWVLSPPSVTWA